VEDLEAIAAHAHARAGDAKAARSEWSGIVRTLRHRVGDAQDAPSCDERQTDGRLVAAVAAIDPQPLAEPRR